MRNPLVPHLTTAILGLALLAPARAENHAVNFDQGLDVSALLNIAREAAKKEVRLVRTPLGIPSLHTGWIGRNSGEKQVDPGTVQTLGELPGRGFRPL